MSAHNHILRGDVIGCPACDERERRLPLPAPPDAPEPPREPDLSAFPVVQHRIEGGRFVCPGDERSRCHQYPGCDGEHDSWPCGHEYESHADCWIKPWIDATDLSDTYSGGEPWLLDEDFPDGDVEHTWEGDYVTFDYVPAAEVRSHPTTNQESEGE